MKKSKKILSSVAGATLALTLAASGAGITAFAATPDPELGTGTVFADGVATSTVEFGETFTVPGTNVKVTAPDGTEQTGAGDSYTADQIGHYIVEYDNGGVTYRYDVLSTSSKVYNIEVDATKIPTVIATGTEVALPTATVYYEEDGEKVFVDGASVTAEVTGGTYTNNKFTTAGSYRVTYTYTLGKGVYASKEFTVTVRDGFADTVKPVLSLSTTEKTANLNTKYSIPVATVSDDYDERVEAWVVITYTENGEEKFVTEVDVDDNGIAYKEEGKTYAAIEKFDNNGDMFFYPTVKGDYKVVYHAKDDAGNEAEPLSFTLTVQDKKGPVLNVDRATIPQTWGYGKVFYTVTDDLGVETEVALPDTTITLPLPEYYDNNRDSALELVLTITDPNEKTVATVKYLASAADNKLVITENSDVKADGEAFVTDALADGALVKFNVGKYVDLVKAKIADESAAAFTSSYKYAGTYKLQYKVVEPVTGSTTYSDHTIEISSENYDGTSEISITPSSIEEFVVLKDGAEFTVPAFTVSSEKDGYLTNTYTISTASAKFVDADGNEYAKFEGGEVLKFSAADSALVYTAKGVDYKLAVNTGDELTYFVKAVSDVGQSKEYTATEKTEIVVPGTTVNPYTVTATSDNRGVKIDLGTVDNKLVDVQLGLRNADYDYISFTATVYYNSVTKERIVSDLTPSAVTKDGTYYFEVRITDVYGSVTAAVYPIDLTAPTTDDNKDSEKSAANKTAVAGNKVNWSNSSISYRASDYDATWVVATAHTVSGGRFVWNYGGITPLSEGKYTVVDKHMLLESSGDPVTLDDALSRKIANSSDKTVVNVSANSAKTVVLDAPMPTYLASGAETSAISNAVIYSADQNFDFTVRVTDPNSTVKNYANYQKFISEFRFSTDGEYTIAYLVNDSAISTYSVRYGDNVAPTFTVESHATEQTVGSTFKFHKVTVTGADSASNLTFKKTIVNPSGETVTDGTISGTGSTYADKEGNSIKLTTAGTWTVTYTVTDKAGNEAKQVFEIKVKDSAKSDQVDYTVLSAVLIVVAAVLIVGVFVFLLTGRKGKKKSKK